jgi:hypothetical protein
MAFQRDIEELRIMGFDIYRGQDYRYKEVSKKGYLDIDILNRVYYIYILRIERCILFINLTGGINCLNLTELFIRR